MNWIWQDYTTDREFVINRSIDPYSETLTYDGQFVFVNTLFRFTELFQGLISSDDSLNEIYQCAVHYLAQLDMLDGISYEKIALDLLGQELLDGAYGEEVSRLFQSDCVTNPERERILYWIYRTRREHGRHALFQQIFSEFFCCADEYAVIQQEIQQTENAEWIISIQKPFPGIYYRRSDETLYYYCGLNQSCQQKEKFRLLQLLFADISESSKDIWGYCFGVTDEPDAHQSCSAVPGEIQLL